MKYYVGIDVGLKGAIAIIEENNVILHDMPERHDFREIEKILLAIPNEESRVIIESQNPFPGQGVVSAFTLGWQVGYINALLDYLKFPYQEIRSAEWMAHYGLHGKKHFDGKKKLYEKAKRLYPVSSLKGNKGAIKDGRVDALLIAHYCKRLYANG